MSQQIQLQKQKSTEKQKSSEQQLQLMYLYDDFNNVVGIANETQAILEYFKDDPQHPMVNVHLNRLILQANLSNGIHKDQQEDSNQTELQATKKDLKKLYKEVIVNPDEYDQRVLNILKFYYKNLDPVMQLRQIDPLPTQKVEFNQRVLQKVVDGMNQMDDKVSQINKGQIYQKKSAQEIQAINKQRKEAALTKISANFPKETKFSKNEDIIDQKKSKDDNQKQQSNQIDLFFSLAPEEQKKHQLDSAQIKQDLAQSKQDLTKNKEVLPQNYQDSEEGKSKEKQQENKYKGTNSKIYPGTQVNSKLSQKQQENDAQNKNLKDKNYPTDTYSIDKKKRNESSENSCCDIF